MKSKFIAGSNLVDVESEMPSFGVAIPVVPTQVGASPHFSYALVLIFVSSLNELGPSSFNMVHYNISSQVCCF